jgi:lysozyme
MSKKTKKGCWRIFIVIAIILIIAGIWIGREYTFTPPPPPVITNEASDIIRHPQTATAWGIDISHHQGSVDWSKMVGDKRPDFVFLKTTEGTHFTDNRFADYKEHLIKLGIPFSGYHFMRFNKNGKDQANYFLRKAQPKKGQLIPVVDIEYQRHLYTDEIAQRNIDLFMETIRSAIGVYPIVYCEEKYYHKYLKKKYKGKIILWIANYKRSPTTSWDIWQKTDKFQHPSFKKRIDYNILQHQRIGTTDLILK